MEERDVRDESAYRDQIRRLQIALMSASWNRQSHSRISQGTALPFSEPREVDAAEPVRQPLPAKSSVRPFLRERSLNARNCGSGVNKSGRVPSATAKHVSAATPQLAVFASAVASTDPFDDLIAKAWGKVEEPSGDVWHEVRGVTQPLVQRGGSVQSYSDDSVSSTTLSPSSSSSAFSPPGSAARADPYRSRRVPTAHHQDRTTKVISPHISTPSKHTVGRPRRAGGAADVRCRLTSAVAACPSAAQDAAVRVTATTHRGDATEKPNQHPPAPSLSMTTAKSASTNMSYRGTNRVVSSIAASSSSSAVSQATHEMPLPLTTAIKDASVATQRSVALSLPEQQRLLSRIQLLDRALEHERSGKSSTQTAQLLRLLRNDHNKPYFKAGPVNWAAVRRLREQLVCSLLGTPCDGDAKPRADRSLMHVASPPSLLPSPEVHTDAYKEAATSIAHKFKDTLDAQFGSITPCEPSASSLSDEVPAKAAVEIADTVVPSPPSAKRYSRASEVRVDAYAASRAAFQRECEVMRQAQERLLRHRQEVNTGGAP